MELRDLQVLTGQQVVHCHSFTVRRALHVISRVYKCRSVLNNVPLIGQHRFNGSYSSKALARQTLPAEHSGCRPEFGNVSELVDRTSMNTFERWYTGISHAVS